MTTQWEYVGIMQLPDAVPSDIMDEWKETLKAEQTRIYANLKNKIPDEASFKERIGDASSDEYESFLYKVGSRWDVSLIEMKQRVKLARSYDTWEYGVDKTFGVGGYFSDRVDSKSSKFNLARYVLGVVGHRASVTLPLKVWNPVTTGVLLLRGDTRPARYFEAPRDVFTGTLEAVVDANKGRLITPSIMAEAVRACVMSKFADEGGLSTVRDTILTNANTVIDALLQVALNTVHAGAGYDVTYVLSWSAPDSNVKLTVTDTHP